MRWLNRYIITGETPAKKNSRITLKNGKTIPSARYREWHSLALAQIENQKQILNINEEVIISLTFTHGDLRRRDSDNGTSSIMDLLVDAGILFDDNWQIVKQIYVNNLYEKGNPSCLIEIEGNSSTV